HESLLGRPAATGGRCRAARRLDLGNGGRAVSALARQRGPLSARAAHGPTVDAPTPARTAPATGQRPKAGSAAGPTAGRTRPDLGGTLRALASAARHPGQRLDPLAAL